MQPAGAKGPHRIVGTPLHGTFESVEFRRRILPPVAAWSGRHGFRVAPDTRFAALRDRTVDLLGDLVEEHLDTGRLWRLIEDGPGADLPFVPPGAPRPPAARAARAAQTAPRSPAAQAARVDPGPPVAQAAETAPRPPVAQVDPRAGRTAERSADDRTDRRGMEHAGDG